jgi:hypothetical protein
MTETTLRETDLCSKKEAAEILQCHPDTLKRWRGEKPLENVHFVKRSARSIRYIRPLIQDLAVNWNNPDGHQRAIENYRSTLLSNQKRKR